jgi:hypothetical protein
MGALNRSLPSLRMQDADDGEVLMRNCETLIKLNANFQERL